ncbi:hypothetical protein [Actinoalloteichus hymeniacidonis]|uniref:OAA-family lectin sugar binding domain-containing protein n=1 Tax=Actinoalloteichus hymeniacidonis TaxID=340345 RepID=A0AAC9N141_9PSEU|nr:hypothetical protein [Actinoalloteichus hymeniacidonis]AOS65506.1 hypothetical protein TL08_23630 [Actinoalloteichus hymeniacidonis]MBB5906407.1 hypothetical protein [Actinoalloteichus hymeniacidonis]
MKPTYADFAFRPPILGNAVVHTSEASAAGSHLAVGAGGSVTLDFTLSKGEEIAEATLKVRALVAKSNRRTPGSAPVDVLVNGELVTERLAIPGGGDLPQDNVLAVPGALLVPGENTLEIRTAADARNQLWLYRITLDSVYERDHSERALGAAHAANSVFAFDTKRCASGHSSWVAAPPLLFHVERGENSVLEHLSWRGTDGAEAAIVFTAEMTGFYGHHRAADGTQSEFRGEVTGRWAFPDGIADARVHRFATEEGWGGGWHRSPDELRFVLDDGGAPVERIAWRDQRCNSGSITVRTGLNPDTGGRPYDFLGIYQRANEGAIGYRGVAVPELDKTLHRD